MKKFAGTNIKTISKVSEYINADAVDIAYDSLDYARAESVKNGVKISRQAGKRRIIDNARNKIAHSEIDYSQFKVTKIESGVTVDNSKKEKQLEDAAMALLADMGIDWSDDCDDSEEESEEVQTVSKSETVVNVEEATISEIIGEEITEYEYRLEVQTINRAESGFPRLGDRKYITFNSTVNDAVSIANQLLKEIDPIDCWGAELWNQSMKYRMEYKWDISNKYARSNQQQCWLDWTGKQL